jgi:hypothetical protein
MSARLPKVLRRREAEDRRVHEFLAAIRATTPTTPTTPRPVPSTAPLPRVQRLVTPRGVVWALDESSRLRLRTDTRELPRIVARASAPLR